MASAVMVVAPEEVVSGPDPDGGPGPDPDSSSSPSGLAHGLRALRHRNYRRFWFGAPISNSGTWLQNLTIPYVLLEITDAAFWVGLAAFAGLFPVMLLGPIAGNLADRFDRRVVLVIGQSLAALAAAVLCIAWVAGVRSPGAIVALAALGGAISGFTMPTWAFGLNALSFGAVLVALALVDPRSTRQSRNPQPIIRGLVESLRYIRRQPGIIAGILLAACVAFLGFPIVSFVVVYAKQVYDVEPWALGLMSGLLGVGAILAAPIVAGVFGDLSRAKTVRVALPFYGLMIIVFGTSTTVTQGAVGLVFAGMGFLTIVATSNTAVQIIVADHIRGSVMATRIMTFTGAYPIGTLLPTSLADVYGPRPVVTTAGLLLVLAGLVLVLRPGLVSHLDDPTDQS